MFNKVLFTFASVMVASAANAGPLLFAVTGVSSAQATESQAKCASLDGAALRIEDSVRWNGKTLLPIGKTSVTSFLSDGCGLADINTKESFLSNIRPVGDPTDDSQAFVSRSMGAVNLGSFQRGVSADSAVLARTTGTPGASYASATAAISQPSFTLGFLPNESAGRSHSCCDDIATVVIPSQAAHSAGGVDQSSMLGFTAAGTFAGQFDASSAGSRQWAEINPVPEPATLTLLGTGLIGIGAMVRRRARRSAKPRQAA